MAEKRESNIGKLKLDVDVSDALKGLKAVKREANEALEAMKKLDEYQGGHTYVSLDGMTKIEPSLAHFGTKELHEELARREGVTEEFVGVYDKVTITFHRDSHGVADVFSGPARILINRD
ncbi:hypothetical protein SAMN05192534_12353 [Alteribacillus persepolensis]|uniref:Uncharacterized protein n=1 Tax=Alteribacillus persepolensis TaxID=568899 RepID=A0A1G8I9D4_9BACI|nr:BC1881 family protein [Alteribacillus persepolensis]SDI15585.1 hypothetical protein SAMN05192534_12353 [Alteribacillus persepolensis]